MRPIRADPCEGERLRSSAAHRSASFGSGALMPTPKTAVLVVHGMGEQRPMDTIWRFVDALWTTDEALAGENAPVFSKPDQIAGNFELRRVTTLEGSINRRIDFYEFYWAHLMTGNTVGSVWAFTRVLLVRWPWKVPVRLIDLWLTGWMFLVLVAAVLVGAWFAVLSPEAQAQVQGHLPGLLDRVLRATADRWGLLLIAPAAAAFLAFLSRRWVGPVAGDAARYLSPTPDNVARRQAIREAGVAVLEKLHAAGAYDRIVVVGHSLGAVIAYDMLNFTWGRIDKLDFGAAHQASAPALEALEEQARAVAAQGASARPAYRAAQRAYAQALAPLDRVGTGGGPAARLWLVSDFITLGSPLSKADVLLAYDPASLEACRERRECPTCPPQLEGTAFSFPVQDSGRSPHHAAVFGPTRWTNIFFGRFWLFGDFIAGPTAPRLGGAIEDIRLQRAWNLFRHLDYWKGLDPASDAVQRLREAVELGWPSPPP